VTGRVAIYAVPGTGTNDERSQRLLRRAESWLGRSIDGRLPASDLPTGWSRSAADEITIDARRYGFHGTLKAPFRLADGHTLEDLEQDLSLFAAANSPVAIPHLSLDTIGDFFALVPGASAAPLHCLADTLVADFDHYRAPATPAEIARRNPAALTTRQRRLLEDMGYPYVFEEFRFHLTVTDRIPAERQCDVYDSLTAWFADSLGRTIPLDAIALFTEAGPGAPFVLHSIHPLHTPPSVRASGAFDDEGTP